MTLSKRRLNPAKSDAIIAAAKALFLKHGYSETTMDAIALKAGLTKQTVYSYYSNKEILFTEMVLGLCAGLSRSDTKNTPDNASFETLLTHNGLKLLELITSAEVLATTRLVIAESERYPKLAKLYYERGTQELVQIIAEFLDGQNKRGVVAIPNTLSAASYFLAMLKGQYYLRMILRVKPLPSEQSKIAHVKDTVKIFMRLYADKHPLNTSSIL